MKQIGIFLFIWIGGSAFCIPDMFISRFYTPQSIWMLCFLSLYTYLYFYFTKIKIQITDGCILNLVSIVLVGIYSLFFSSYIDISSLWIVIVVSGLLISNIQNISKQLPFAFEMLAILGMIEALWALGQYVHILPAYHSQFRMTGSFDNPAGLAVFLSVLFPFALTLIKYKNKVYSIGGYCIAILICFVVFLSNSRTGMLAIGSVISVRIYILMYQRKIKIKWVYLFIFMSALVVIGLSMIKKKSVNGRLLIWNISYNMIKDKAVFGHGTNAFESKYMLYQAAYFYENPNSNFKMLADNVKHPFNEYLKIIVEYGIIGFAFLLLYGLIGFTIYKKNKIIEKRPVLECLMAIGICACFSYPLNYPVIWGLVAFSISISFYHEQEGRKIPFFFIFQYIICFFSILLFFKQIQLLQIELEWKRIADRSLRGETRQMLPKYVKLYSQFEKNGLFLYNYGAELNILKKYDESSFVLIECTHFLNDLDVQLLLADNYVHREMYDQAELCLKQASLMCPNRFLPLYQLVKLYDKTNRKVEAYKLALEITSKPVKVYSFINKTIIDEMKKYIQENNTLGVF